MVLGFPNPLDAIQAALTGMKEKVLGATAAAKASTGSSMLGGGLTNFMFPGMQLLGTPVGQQPTTFADTLGRIPVIGPMLKAGWMNFKKWMIIGTVATVILIVAIIFFVMRKKKATTPEPTAAYRPYGG